MVVGRRMRTHQTDIASKCTLKFNYFGMKRLVALAKNANSDASDQIVFNNFTLPKYFCSRRGVFNNFKVKVLPQRNQPNSKNVFSFNYSENVFGGCDPCHLPIHMLRCSLIKHHKFIKITLYMQLNA